MEGAGGGPEGSVASQDPSGGFMVEDGYLSDDEGVQGGLEGTIKGEAAPHGTTAGQNIDPRLFQIKQACDRASKGNRCLVALGPSAGRLVHSGGLTLDPKALEALCPIFPTVKTPPPHAKMSRFEEYGIYAGLAPPPELSTAHAKGHVTSGALGLPSTSLLPSGAVNKVSGGKGKPFPPELVDSLREFISQVKSTPKLSTVSRNFSQPHDRPYISLCTAG